MFNDIIRGQFEVLDLNMARVLHGYLLRDPYVWFISGTGYSGVMISVRATDLAKTISMALTQNKGKYGCTIDVTDGDRNTRVNIDPEGCGELAGKFLHFSTILTEILPREPDESADLQHPTGKYGRPGNYY